MPQTTILPGDSDHGVSVPWVEPGPVSGSGPLYWDVSIPAGTDVQRAVATYNAAVQGYREDITVTDPFGSGTGHIPTPGDVDISLAWNQDGLDWLVANATFDDVTPGSKSLEYTASASSGQLFTRQLVVTHGHPPPPPLRIAAATSCSDPSCRSA